MLKMLKILSRIVVEVNLRKDGECFNMLRKEKKIIKRYFF